MSENQSWIREERIKNDITQKDLAKQVGVSLSTIKRWEKSQTEPKMSDIKKLYDIFKMRRKL